MSNGNNKPSRGRPKTLNKTDVVEVAMRAYWQEGPARVSLNSICQRAGVAKPSLYREFGNEDGLASAALESYVQNVLIKVLEILAEKGSFADKFDRVTYLVAEDAQHEQGCLFVKMRAEKLSLGAKTQSMIAKTESFALQAYARFLEDARNNGDWSGCIPVDLGAQYIYAQIGMAMAHRARGDGPSGVLKLAFSVFKS